MNAHSSELLKAVALTAELCGRVLSPEAAVMFVSDLSGYPEHQVFKALQRCRKQVRGVMTVQDVVSRLDDGRPGADEAWSLLVFNDQDSTVWTEEAAQAFGLVRDTYESGDRNGARIAFRSAYERLVSDARDERRPVRWSPSLGEGHEGRRQALERAERLGRIGSEQLALAAPDTPASPRLAKLIERAFRPSGLISG